MAKRLTIFGHLFLVAFLVNALHAAEPTPEKIKAYLAACEKEKKKAIEKYQARIDWRPIGVAELKKKANKTRNARNLKADIARINSDAKEAKEEIEKLRSGKIRPPNPSLAMPPKLNDIGALPTSQAEVINVIDRQRMVVELRYEGPAIITRNPGPGGAPSGNLLESRFLTRAPGIGDTFTSRKTTLKALALIRGVPTAGIADGTEATLPDVYEVTGTWTGYTASGGDKTVMVLEPFDVKAAEAYLQKAEDGKAKSAAK